MYRISLFWVTLSSLKIFDQVSAKESIIKTSKRYIITHVSGIFVNCEWRLKDAKDIPSALTIPGKSKKFIIPVRNNLQIVITPEL